MYWWFLTVMIFTANIACGLCLAGAITITAFGGDATMLWLGAAVCFVVWVILANLRIRAEKPPKAP
jgi:hypothetical protein